MPNPTSKSNGPIELKRVETKKDWDDFIEFQWTMNAGDPQWVPPLRISVREMLDVNKNPFFKHATMLPLLAIRDGKIVGRVVGAVDENHNKFQDEKTVFFGFFECVDEPQVAQKMLDEVSKWGKSKGMTVLRGPVNLSTNHECGLLVEGFETPPTLMMLHNPKYYASLLEEYGCTKAKDLYAWVIHHENEINEKIYARSEKIKQASGIVFRQINIKDFEGEISKILEVYNDAWEKNWGFVPMEPEEFRHMAKDMKMIMDPRMLLVAEVKGKPAGFMLCLPDVNQVFKKIPDGKLSLTNIVKMLWNLKGPGRKKTINRCRIITLGVKRAYRELGLAPVFYTEALKRGPKYGYPEGEASWILEDNAAMNQGINHMGGKRSKVYRIYDRPLA